MKRIWPIGIMIALWLLFSFPYWGKGLVPFPSRYLVTFFAPWSASHGMPVKNNAMPDVITQIYPWKRVTIDAWKHGELPLWNPYSFSGTQHAGNYQSAVFSPVNILFFALSETDAWSVMILLQPVLAGLFMFLLLRSLSVSREGSVIGAISFMFSGFMVVWMAYGTLGYAVLWLPLVLYGLHAYVSRGSAWSGLAVAFGMCFSLLSGHFQMSIYVFLYAAGFALFLLVRGDNRQRAWRAMLLLFSGVLLAAPQVFPSYDAYAQSVRSGLFLKGEVIPWRYIVTLFSPDFYGNPVTRNDWFGHYAEWAGYVGIVPLLLSLVGASLRRRNTVIPFFSAAAVIPLVLAFQTPLVDLLYALRIPVLSTSSASRIIVLLSFSLAVLSGFGLDAVRVVWEKREWQTVRRLCIGIVCPVMFLWVVLFVVPLQQDKLFIAAHNTYLPTAYAAAFLVVVVLGYFLPKRWLAMLPFLLLMFTSADMYRFAAKWMPFDERAFVYPVLPVTAKTGELIAAGNGRVFGNIGNEAGSALGIPLIEGYDAVYQERYGRFVTAVSTGMPRTPERSVVRFDKNGKYAEDALQLLGVRYYLHKKSDGRLPWAYPFWKFPQYDRVWEDDHFEILENTTSFPRAFLASSYVVRTDESGQFAALFAPGMNRRETLVLEEEPRFVPTEGSGSATITAYRSNGVEIITDSPVPKLLFLSDVYDAGWRVTVDGTRERLMRADYDFRAVSLPAGRHTVRMRYLPASIAAGFAVSGFATLSVVALLIWKRKD